MQIRVTRDRFYTLVLLSIVDISRPANSTSIERSYNHVP